MLPVKHNFFLKAIVFFELFKAISFSILLTFRVTVMRLSTFMNFFFSGFVTLPATLLKKRLWHRCFPVNFAKFLITPFSKNTSG